VRKVHVTRRIGRKTPAVLPVYFDTLIETSTQEKALRLGHRGLAAEDSAGLVVSDARHEEQSRLFAQAAS
jgi:hypothetical protein